jgi:hypothetical protein
VPSWDFGASRDFAPIAARGLRLGPLRSFAARMGDEPKSGPRARLLFRVLTATGSACLPQETAAPSDLLAPSLQAVGSGGSTYLAYGFAPPLWFRYRSSERQFDRPFHLAGAPLSGVSVLPGICHTNASHGVEPLFGVFRVRGGIALSVQRTLYAVPTALRCSRPRIQTLRI